MGPPLAGRAFTLIELLIVVSIISILSAIAVPNFLEAQTRAKVARVKADMRSLSTALEAYRVDNNKYPPRTTSPIIDYESSSPQPFALGDTRTRQTDLSLITTPISYISAIPEDVFEKRIAYPNAILDYYPPELVTFLMRSRNIPGASASNGWVLFSIGPDNVFGVSGTQGNYPPRGTGGRETNVTSWNNEYDPTNGTVSLGNVYRFQNIGANGTRVFNE